ncbi:MAG: hypothetical protein LQ340_000593 [Diploschistes diacapsis]|nr:MAG: hypothetical protein LQ340_000593 [Diploschistes diacapsis]
MASRTSALLLTLSLVATTALSFSLNPLSLFTPSAHMRRASNPELGYPFLVNCWASPGARSEVDWFSAYPTDFGSATPNSSTVVSPGNNYVWEDGGSCSDPAGGTLNWNISNKNASTNAQAGTATDGSINYLVLRDTDSTLYKQGGFNCIVVYRLQQQGGGSTSATSSEPASSNSTQVPVSISSFPVSTDAVTTATAVPDAGNTNNDSSGGLSEPATIGVGVGVGVGAALVLGALGFLLWQRRRASRKSDGPMTGVYSEKKGAYPVRAGTAEAEAEGMGGHMRAELHQESINELGGDSWAVEAPVEAEQRGTRYELDGGEVRR